MKIVLRTIAFEAIVAILDICVALLTFLAVGIAGTFVILFCVPLWAFMAAVAEVRRWGSAA